MPAAIRILPVIVHDAAHPEDLDSMNCAIEPPVRPALTLAEQLHRLETVRLAALVHGDYPAADRHTLSRTPDRL